MNSEALEQVISKCNKKEYTKNESIGIANVSGRIKVEFGDEYGLNIESETDIGTTVTLELPAISKKTRISDNENFNCR